MKAKDLKKVSISIDEIHKQIDEVGDTQHKIFIPHWTYVEDIVILNLINNGFKVYNGNWDGIMVDCLIIEW